MALKTGSQSSRILAVLADRKWHTSAEIHQRAGFTMLNSRIASLREKEYVFESRHVPGKTGAEGHEYRLVAEPSQVAQDLERYGHVAYWRFDTIEGYELDRRKREAA